MLALLVQLLINANDNQPFKPVLKIKLSIRMRATVYLNRYGVMLAVLRFSETDNFAVQPSQGFADNGVKKRNYLVRALLPEVRGE